MQFYYIWYVYIGGGWAAELGGHSVCPWKSGSLDSWVNLPNWITISLSASSGYCKATVKNFSILFVISFCVTVASLTVVKSCVHKATVIPVHAVFLRTSVEEGWKYEPWKLNSVCRDYRKYMYWIYDIQDSYKCYTAESILLGCCWDWLQDFMILSFLFLGCLT